MQTLNASSKMAKKDTQIRNIQKFNLIKQSVMPGHHNHRKGDELIDPLGDEHPKLIRKSSMELRQKKIVEEESSMFYEEEDSHDQWVREELILG
jgi:hypothetical protein